MMQLTSTNKVFQMFSILNEISDNSHSRTTAVILGSNGTAAAIYILIAIAGYLSFGNDIGGNIVAEYVPSVAVTIGRAAIVVLVMFSFQHRLQTSIIGRVNPVDGATSARAIAAKDTVFSNIVNGGFSFSVKPGIYQVFINAVRPYKDAVLENISVKEDQAVDVGEITLQK